MTVNDDYLSENKKGTINRKCPSCGAELEFSPSEKVLKCPFCQTEVSINLNTKAIELDFNKIFEKNNDWGNETAVYQCKNCGAKEIVSNKDIATKCSFCGTPNVVKTNELSGFKPNGVIPFNLTKDQAAEKAVKWVKKKFFVVRSFKKSVKSETISGCYEPSFTFDCNTQTAYSGVLGKYETKVRRVNGRTETYREIKYFNISGNKACGFDDVLVDATSNDKERAIKLISPFDTNNSKDYDESFLLGFSASQYDKEPKECWGLAIKEIDESIKRAVLSGYHYDVVKTFNASTEYNDKTFKYVLLPIYVGYFMYKNKQYNYFVNGETGRIAGKAPLSAIKILLVVLIALLAIGGILLAVYFGYSKGMID